MKRKGFTLIELLAVIVILAIVALISVPIIIGVINKSRKGAFEDSAYGIVDAAKIYYAEHATEKIKGTTFTFPSDTKLKINGTKPKIGSVILEENGKVAIAVSDGKWCALKEKEEEKVRVIEYDKNTCKVEGMPNKVYKDGTAIYYNPNTNKKCAQNEAVSTTLTKSGCMKWYAFLDNEKSAEVKMLLDHNTTGGIHLIDTNHMKEVLEEETKGWIAKARYITADEIAEITGAKKALNWNTSVTYAFYLDGSRGTDPSWTTQIANASNRSIYAWLYDNLLGCVEYGCNKEDNGNYMTDIPAHGGRQMYGYYTATSDQTYHTWNVRRYGYLTTGGVVEPTGITGTCFRPMITIPKSILE